MHSGCQRIRNARASRDREDINVFDVSAPRGTPGHRIRASGPPRGWHRCAGTVPGGRACATAMRAGIVAEVRQFGAIRAACSGIWARRAWAGSSGRGRLAEQFRVRRWRLAASCLGDELSTEVSGVSGIRTMSVRISDERPSAGHLALKFRVVATGLALALAGAVMPSAMHQVLVALLLERPEVLTSVLTSAAERVVPRDARIRPATTTFTNLSPPSYHADLAFRVEDAAGTLQELVIGEVQLGRDRRNTSRGPST